LPLTSVHFLEPGLVLMHTEWRTLLGPNNIYASWQWSMHRSVFIHMLKGFYCCHMPLNMGVDFFLTLGVVTLLGWFRY